MPDGVHYRVLFAASEVVGFAKTGGLADVVGSLPRALERRGHACAVLLPLYRCARTGMLPVAPTGHTFTVPVGPRAVSGRLWQSRLPGSDVPVYLVEQPDYFERDDPAQGRGLYQFTLAGGQKRDYPDNCERFTFFGRAVLEAVRLLDFRPNVLHNNDWQTGLVPVYLREEYRRRPGYERLHTLFTIHNIAYQGNFWHWDLPLTGLDWRLFNFQQLEFHGWLSFLKAGIVFSDLLNTVSPSYAREIQTPYYGCGLEGVLAERRDRLFGIVNGVDYAVWDPATDPSLAANYDAQTVAEGKPRCKAALQRHYRLPERPRTPLLAVVSRLAYQKGIELVCKAAEALLAGDAQLVVLGEGDPAYHRLLQDLRARHPDRVGITLDFDEPLAHQIEAGADLFLMPSLYEPSGLNQLYSLKYGTVPVVRATGGLADTITDCTPQTLADGTATGFTFVAQTPGALLETVQRALALYRERPESWLQVQRTGMQQDWSWDRSAAEYERLYAKLKEKKT
jgi:starch synthase